MKGKSIKFIIFTSLLFSSFVKANFEKSLSQLDKKAKRIKKLVGVAKECLPVKKNGSTNFCTGFSISDKFYKQLINYDYKSCVKAISKKGYSVLTKAIDESSLAFYNSFSNAQTNHEKKRVLLKSKSIPLCIHELLHIYQFTNKSKSPLSPARRAMMYNSFVKELKKAISYVSKEKKKEKATKMAARLSPFIQLSNDWVDVDLYVDEKEIHYFIYENCDDFNCSVNDLDIAISNLLNYKKVLSEKVYANLRSEALVLLTKKMNRAKEQAYKSWKGLTIKEMNQLKGKFDLSWHELVSSIKREKLPIYRFVPSGVELLKNVPDDVFKSFKMVPKDYLQKLSKSKMSKGKAHGKYFCRPDNVIVVTKEAYRSTLIHEYLHFLQNKKNPDYCKSINEQERLDKMYKEKKISRVEFEQKVLYYQALNSLAEVEVYQFLVNFHSGAKKEERASNIQMLQYYKNKLK